MATTTASQTDLLSRINDLSFDIRADDVVRTITDGRNAIESLRTLRVIVNGAA